MKHKLTIFACLLTMAGNTQYFEHRYGVSGVDNIGSGQFTDYTGKGHIFSGQHVVPNASELILVRTEQNGDIVPGPYFKNRYKMFDASNTINYDVLDSKVMEFNNLTYGVVGVCQIDVATGQQALFYHNLDNLGNPLFGEILTTFNPALTYTIHGVRVADSGSEFYLCGMVFDGVQNYAVVMKIDIASGTIIWGNTYMVDSSVASGEPEEAYDIIEYPLTGDLLVVGQRHVCSTTSDDGFIMHLNPTNGQFNNTTDFYGDPNGADAFVSIDRAAAGGAFYVGGWSGSSLITRDNWATRFDLNLILPTWSSLFEYNAWTADNYGIDILERTNTSNVPYLYSLARTENGLLGQSDIEIDQIDAGTGIAVQQFSYGNIRHEYPANIHQYNSGGAGDGLSVYSMREYASGNMDLMLHKCYFNGYTSCNYSIDYRPEFAGPGYLYSVKSRIVDLFRATPNNLIYSNTLNDLAICHDSIVPGGSNALMINNEQEGSFSTQLFQTPENDVVLVMKTTEKQLVNSELRNASGSVIRKFGTTVLTEGETRIPIDLNGLSLATGIYFIVWNNGNETGTEKLIIR
jgi:hypothetical protein